MSHEATFHLSRLTMCRQKGIHLGYAMHQLVSKGFGNLTDERVLWRAEETPSGYLCLVQSQTKPDWTAIERALETCDQKAVRLEFHNDQRLRFRLRANPTVKREGKRHGLRHDEQLLAWLTRKGAEGGFEPENVLIMAKRDYGSIKQGQTVRHFGADFEGLLRITNAEHFTDTLVRGIGSAKGFGFGLLSLAPARG